MESMEEITKRYHQRIIEEEQKEFSDNVDKIKNFKNLCNEKGIQLSDSNISYVRTIGIVACYPNLILLLNPRIEKDKENLVNCNILNTQYKKKSFATGFLYDPDYMIMAHPYFRRGFNEKTNFAPRFIELFWSFNKPDIDLYIALDFNRVRINVSDVMYMELDTWYGARFTNNIDQIPDGISKLRPPLDLNESQISFIFNNAYSLDVLWETKPNIRTFQVEEFKTEDVIIKINDKIYHPVRYIHSEYDLKEGFFRHFDGAVHLYSENEYYERRDSDFNYNMKHIYQIKSNSEKLFKMNGKIHTDTWLQYTSQFFTGSPLIIEYFEGKYPDKLNDIIQKIRKNKI